jgi:recombinational DNA repair protein (RecF pathway)
MSHHIYSTPAIIMNLFADGEESVIAECLTAQLGRIFVSIQGAKKIVNKHRNHIFIHSAVMLDCVVGRHSYRCTGIAQWRPLYRPLVNLSKTQLSLIRQSFGLIQRLVPSGIPIPEVFDAFEKYFFSIINDSFSDDDARIITLVAQLRMLGILGYWNSDWTDEVLLLNGKTFMYVAQNKKSVEKLIDKILIETQMTVKN